jgi:trehalose 6-phosphate synthase
VIGAADGCAAFRGLQYVHVPNPFGAADAQRDVIAPARGLRAYLPRLLAEGGRLVVASNRGPLHLQRTPQGWQVQRGSGGLVTALAEVGRYAPVTWVSAAMDRDGRRAAGILRKAASARARGEGEPPPGSEGSDLLAAIAAELPGQDLRLALCEVPDPVYQAHYAQFCNPFLWFLQHEMYALPYEPHVDDRLLAAWNDGYRVVNTLMAQEALRAAGSNRPVVMLQDYHLYLAGREIRARRPESLLLHFTHIPWPADSAWRALPQGLRRDICEGLLANDIVGFQTDRYASNFLQTVARFVRDARVDPDGRNVRWQGRTIWVRPYPISVDPGALIRFARGPAVAARREALRERLVRAGGPKLIVRVDRLEPSKNVYRGFLAFEALLARRPELRQRVRFLAVVSFSRAHLPEYRQYASAVREIVARINGLADPDTAPIWLVDGTDYAMAIAALTLADVALVNPVVDGMNLVAKEAVLVGRPVLVLSETAGSAEQLAGDALTVAAIDVTGTTRMLEAALEMPDDERQRRLARLRASVHEEDLEWWLSRQLRDLVAVAEGRRPPSRRLRDTLRRAEPA